MTVKLLTKHHLEFLSLKEAAEAHPSLHLSKCHIVGTLMPRLIFNWSSNHNVVFLHHQAGKSFTVKRIVKGIETE